MPTSQQALSGPFLFNLSMIYYLLLVLLNVICEVTCDRGNRLRGDIRAWQEHTAQHLPQILYTIIINTTTCHSWV